MKAQFFSLLATLAITLSGCGGGASAPESSESATAASGSASAVAVSPDAGNISGVVKFSGTAPKPRKISMGADAFCKTVHNEEVRSEELVVSDRGEVKNVYVFVKSGLKAANYPPPKQPVVLDQVGCMYRPHVVAAQVGQAVVIRNSDGVLHNVNARPTNNKPFNIGQPVKGMENRKTFENVEVAIPVKCDVHPWMSGYIAVQSHPFHMVTGDDGKFDLKGLPPGTYELEAWHEKLGTTTQSVTLGAKEDKSVTFTFAAKS